MMHDDVQITKNGQISLNLSRMLKGKKSVDNSEILLSRIEFCLLFKRYNFATLIIPVRPELESILFGIFKILSQVTAKINKLGFVLSQDYLSFTAQLLQEKLSSKIQLIQFAVLKGAKKTDVNSEGKFLEIVKNQSKNAHVELES